MKIREGFVTNSSSTNFIIICKEELTPEYLYKKLGFKEESPLREKGMNLCEEIIYGTSRGPRWYNYDNFNYNNIKEMFGEKTAEKYKKLSKKNYHLYIGHTGNDDELINFFTTDSFIIDEKDFYINGQNCVW